MLQLATVRAAAINTIRAMSTLVRIWLRSLGSSRLYLVAVVAVAVAAWLLASLLASPFLEPNLDQQTGGVTIMATGVSGGHWMPVSYVSRVAAVQGVHGLMYMNATQIVCGSEAFAVTLEAYGGPDAASLLARGDGALGRRWTADRTGVLVSPAAAQRCGWKPGMTISPRDMVLNRPIEMHVVGIAPASAKGTDFPTVYAHYAYFNAIPSPMIRRDMVLAMVAIPAHARDARALAARIEGAFASSYPAIDAHTNAAVQNGLARFGKVQYVLLAIMAAVLLCATLVMVSVLAYAFAQRVAQQAMLQVLGFSRRTLFAAFALASLVLVLAGVAAGLGAGLLAVHWLRNWLAHSFYLPGLPGWAWWGLPIWLGMLLLVALLWPALRTARLRPVQVRAI